jgi:hypothetical protein
MRAKVLLIVIGVYLVDVLFTLFELDTTVWKFHPFYDGFTFPNGQHWNGWKSNNQIVYDLFSFVSRAMILLAAYLAVMNGVRLKIFMVCFFIELSDMVDYWLFNNSWWKFIPKFDLLFIKDVEFEYNYAKLAIIICFAVYEWRPRT